MSGPRAPLRCLVLAGLVVGVVACGPGDGSSPDGSSPTGPPPAPSTETRRELASGSPGPSGSTRPPGGDGSPTAASTTPSSSPSGAAGPTGPPAWEEAASGFDAVVATLVDPRSEQLLVVELAGRITTIDGEVVLDITDRVTVGGEQGLLDATTTPDGQRLLVHYSGEDGRTVLSSFPITDDGAGLADPADETRLLTFDQPASNHNGGSVVFGPDGWLYFALGDGGRANDAFGNGSDPSTPLGAVLRLDVTTNPGTAVPPPGNPFVDGGGGDGDPRVWAHGLRNPWRITTDGERWYVADVGQDAVEEVTVVPATDGPHDLGWPDREGDFCRVDVCEDDSLEPVATLTHADGACSIIGGAVAARPAVDAGSYFYTDLCDPRVWRLDPATGTVTEDAALPDGTTPLALDLDVDGHVVALTEDGRVLRRVRP